MAMIFWAKADMKEPMSNPKVVALTLRWPRSRCKWRYSDGYSGYVYDMKSVTQDGVIYPSLDPSIFEVKYPNTDIQGRVV